MTDRIAALEKLLDGPRDGPLLRLGLGNAYLDSGDAARAVAMFRSAVDRDGAFTAAWKGLGKALVADGRDEEAGVAYAQGIAVAEARGDLQAAKEMKVFLRRSVARAAAKSG